MAGNHPGTVVEYLDLAADAPSTWTWIPWASAWARRRRADDAQSARTR